MFLKPNTPNRKDLAGSEHIEALYSYAMILTHNPTDAEDLVVEAYVRAIAAIERRSVVRNVKIWLFTILRNVWINELERRATRPSLVEIDRAGGTAILIAETSQDPGALYAARADCEQMREAIRNLSEESREVILLREYEGLSYEEMASVLNCPIETVISRLGRSRSKLQTLLSDACNTQQQQKGRRAINVATQLSRCT
jgi:RNA polymerase sigma-70 factor (ECF subfamily)